jgi:hypothetical protein
MILDGAISLKKNIVEILVDHAFCEQKAASNVISISVGKNYLNLKLV